MNKPKYIPNNYKDLSLTSAGLYTVKDGEGRIIYYMDPTIFDNLYLDDFQREFHIKEIEFPSPFWVSYKFREDLMHLSYSELDSEFAINYSQKYDRMNNSRIITKKELEFLKYQRFYAGKCIDKYGLKAYQLDIDTYINEYLAKRKELPFYLEFNELNFENWQYLVLDQKDNKYYLTLFNNSNYYNVNGYNLQKERIFSIPVIEDQKINLKKHNK